MYYTFQTYQSTAAAPCKVMRLNDLLKCLEDQGEVNYAVAEHQLTKNDSGDFSIKSLVPVCFILDPLKVKRKKTKAFRG